MFTDRPVSRLGMLLQETTHKLTCLVHNVVRKRWVAEFVGDVGQKFFAQILGEIYSNKDCLNDRNTSSDVCSGILQSGVE